MKTIVMSGIDKFISIETILLSTIFVCGIQYRMISAQTFCLHTSITVLLLFFFAVFFYSFFQIDSTYFRTCHTALSAHQFWLLCVFFSLSLLFTYFIRWSTVVAWIITIVIRKRQLNREEKTTTTLLLHTHGMCVYAGCIGELHCTIQPNHTHIALSATNNTNRYAHSPFRIEVRRMKWLREEGKKKTITLQAIALSQVDLFVFPSSLVVIIIFL